MSLKRQARELREKRARLIMNGREITERAESEGRAFTAEEEKSYSAMWDEIHELQARADRLETEAAELAKIDELEDRKARGAGEPGNGVVDVESRFAHIQDPKIRRSFVELGISNPNDFRFDARYLDAFNNMLRTGDESRALSAGSDPDGGYTVPAQWLAGFMEKVRDAVFVEQFATMDMLATGDSLGRVTLETRPDDADWTSELATGTEDSAMKFGKRELNPHPLAKRVKVSKKLIRASAENVPGIVSDQLAYKFGITKEKGYMTGTGAGQPLGLFTASADGISTARDMATGNTTTSIGADGLKNAKWNQKAGYLPNARWVFHRDAMAQIDKLKDGNNAYLLQPDIRQGTGDVLLGLPVSLSEYAPNTFTTGLYVGLVGDLRYYWIVKSLDFTLQALFELYAETNQNGYIGRAEADAMPVFEEAFTRVTLA